MNIDINELKEISISALKNAYKIHESLGLSGEELIKKNQFGDTTLRVDIEAEKAVINTLQERNIPIRIISEEHGTIDITDNPIFLGVLDGLDGSNIYKKERGKGRYGTMFAIFSGLDPKYNDYIFSGIMEHSTRRLFHAFKNKGSFVIENDNIIPIKCSSCKTLDKETRVYIDEKDNDQKWHPFMKEIFTNKLKGYDLKWLGSSAVYYADLASGNADLALECTRKGNLEIAVAYGLVTESGGVIISLEGTSLESKKYLEFGQDKYIPVISAATKELALKLIEYIN
ncbi:MAG: hypothetical protein KKF89_04810 [Nanoarchaeota archaeon]|nr:hypothetical protein [Nanoarchaeota archaeon]MBU1855015.1 hypothetical protein [Nanoarchaeota archaeon]